MSGGSYEYLCYKDAGGLIEIPSTLQEMADDLAALGYADDAARETMDLLLDLRAFRIRLEARLERLSPVWKAQEWWRSCDWDEDRLREALEAYRG